MSKVVYREHAPPAALASHVECFWTSTSDGAVEIDAPSRVLPDGCADVIFDFGDRGVRVGVADHGERSYVVGTMTEALLVRHAGRADLLAVRFLPGGARAFLGLPLAELTDTTVALGDLGGAWRALVSRMHAAATPAERQAILTAALTDRFQPDPGSDRLIGAAWSRIVESAGALPVRALADGLGVGERRLQRLFRGHVGLSPKEAARFARFRAVLDRMERRPADPLGRVGLEAGYYDQPHFIREFSRFAGVSPEAWRRERRARRAPAEG
jgi:AraC-like DNA-binding protein